MAKRIMPSLAVFIFFFCLLSRAFALQPYFKGAQKAEEAGNYDKALSFYNKVFERFPYETKSVLRAYDRILDIYEIKKDAKKKKDVIAYLKNNYPDQSFDARDIEKLSLIYLKFGDTDEALKLQWKMIADGFPPQYTETVLRTYSRLFKYYKEKKDNDRVAKLLGSLSFFPSDAVEADNLYEYAMLQSKYGTMSDALSSLRKIVADHPNTLPSRKALFVLAEQAQKDKDCGLAIEYYNTYIQRFPENTFYVQKAYQRIVDCHLVTGDANLSEDLMKQVADWLNGVSDYRSQLNLAIDLKYKNRDGLAETIFDAGRRSAEKVVAENPTSYEALKAYLEIERSAHAMGKFEMVEQAALATLTGFEELKGAAELNDSVSFIKSQAYLWLAKTYGEQKRYDEAIGHLEEFLRRYPEHKDINYALYELGKAYEYKGIPDKAREYYAMVASEPLKQSAEERLKGLK